MTPHDLVLWTGYATVVVVAINLFRLRVIAPKGRLDRAALWTLRTTGILPLFACVAAACVAFVILDQFPDLVFLVPVSVNAFIAIGATWSITRSLKAIRAQRERNPRSRPTAS